MKNEFIFLDGARAVGWRLESAGFDEIIFYHLAEGDIAEEKLVERIPSDFRGKLVLSRPPKIALDIPYYVVAEKHWMEGQRLACDMFHPMPTHLRLLAVTGTNGKTTTADLCLQLGEQAGLVGFSVGTLGVRSNGHSREDFAMTTPGYIQLRQIIAHYGAKSDFAVLEVSSHALAQDRVHGLVFAAAAWTNLTQDHLDYHGSMEKYEEAKMKIFEHLAPGAHLYTPSSQPWLVKKLSEKKSHKVTASLPQWVTEKLPTFFGTRFNRENLECAVELVRTLKVDEKSFHWSDLCPPPGRFYLREWANRKAVVDFAHTPDALENICRALKESFPKASLIVLFGCGGDRDKGKRPLMGAAVSRHADRIVLTSDNPRHEDPMAIIRDILPGIKSSVPHTIEPDRHKAVRQALDALQANEVLLMAGKGHEDYIQIGAVKHPYSDIEELDDFVKEYKRG